MTPARPHTLTAMWRRPLPLGAVLVLVALVAFLTRGYLALRGPGLNGLFYRDDGVYYAGAAALLHGRLPYADFTYLHPPGMLLTLLPFAGLGAVTSDPLGLAAARIAFWALGALNAALAARVAAREGRLAATVAGLAYALWYPALFTEATMLLEPLGNTAILAALLLLGRTTRAPSAREEVLAGVLLGLSACVKVWMVTPLAVLVVWRLLSAGWRAGARVAGGAVLAAAVVLLPFLAGTGSPMVRMVVLDQLGRLRYVSLLDRVVSISGVGPLAAQVDRRSAAIVLAIVCAVALAAVVLAATGNGRMRLYVVLLLTQTAVVMQGPPYFHHYAAFVAVPLCLVLAAAVARVGVLASGRASGADASASARGAPGRPQLLAAAGTCVLLAALYSTTLTVPTGSRFPGRELARAVADRPCVVTDDPTVLAALNVLTRDLRRGCPLVVDVFGLATDGFDMQWRGALPTDNPRWQRSMSGYLESGSATVVVIPHSSGLNADSIARLSRLPVLAEHGGYQVRQGTGAAATPPAVGPDRGGG